MATAPAYERLPQDQDNDLDKEDRDVESIQFRDGEQNRSWLMTLRNVLVISLALWGTIDLILRSIQYKQTTPIIAHHSHDTNKDRSNCSCGSTADEAIANGCTFDPFAAAWAPPRCIDTELIELFQSLDELQHNKTMHRADTQQLQSRDQTLAHPSNSTLKSPFYAFPGGVVQLSIEEVSQLALPPKPGRQDSWVFTTTDWHFTHCIYVLLKIARARETGVGIEPRYTDLHHTKHCAVSLLNWIREKSDVGALDGISEIDVYP